MTKSVTLFIVSVFLFSTSFSQKIVDSVKIYEFPVKEGVIYQYEAKTVYASFNAMPIITVSTRYDSVYHFEEGTITDVRRIDNFWAVCLENNKHEMVVYSNLKTPTVHIGEKLRRGDCIGAIDKDYADEMNQVDVLIFQKGKEIPYKKIMDYMRRNISCSAPKSYTL